MRDDWRAFWRGLCGTFGIFSPPRRVKTPEESFQRILNAMDEADEIARGAIELPRAHDLAPRRWQLPSGTIIAEAVNGEAVELLKSDPDEYFRRTRSRR